MDRLPGRKNITWKGMPLEVSVRGVLLTQLTQSIRTPIGTLSRRILMCSGVFTRGDGKIIFSFASRKIR